MFVLSPRTIDAYVGATDPAACVYVYTIPAMLIRCDDIVIAVPLSSCTTAAFPFVVDTLIVELSIAIVPLTEYPRCRIAPTPPTLHVVLADAVTVKMLCPPSVVENTIPVDPALTVAVVMYT